MKQIYNYETIKWSFMFRNQNIIIIWKHQIIITRQQIVTVFSNSHFLMMQSLLRYQHKLELIIRIKNKL